MFSSRIVPVIEAFFRDLHIPLGWAEDGSCSLAFDRLGVLSLLPAARGQRCLASLAFLPGRNDAASRRRLLGQAGFDAATGGWLHAGMAADGAFVLTLDLPEEGLDLPQLDAMVRRLQALRELWP